MRAPFLGRSDNGVVFARRVYTSLVRSHGVQQAFITPHSSEQNGMVQCLLRTLNEQCVHRHRIESQVRPTRVIGDWIAFYNQQRPQEALKMMTPKAAYVATLAARPE